MRRLTACSERPAYGPAASMVPDSVTSAAGRTDLGLVSDHTRARMSPETPHPRRPRPLSWGLWSIPVKCCAL